MSTGLLMEPIPSPDSDSATAGPRFRPYSSPNHHVTKGRYITSNDSRGYIPVYEYPLNGQWIMLDMDDGYVLWTGIWKALGNSKADIVKMVESQPDLASKLRRVRGGYLKIQGTWMPYEIALRLSRRVAWPIRHELIPLFGPTFPSTCLSPDQPGYGQVVKPGTGKRRQRRTQQTGISSEPAPDWTVISPAPHPSAGPSRGTLDGPFAYHPRRQFDTERRQQLSQAGAPIELHLPYSNQSYPTSPATASTSGLLEATPSRLSGLSYPGNTTRFSPYPPQPQSVPLSSHSSHSPYGLEERRGSQSSFQEDIRLPPIQAPSSNCAARRNSVALPPISTLDGLRKGPQDDSAAVLRRLQCIDDDDMDFGVNSSRSNEHYSGAYHTTIPLRPHQIPSMSTSAKLPPIYLPSSGHSASPPSPYMTSRTGQSSSINSPASTALITPPPLRSSLHDARAYHSCDSPLASVAKRGLMLAPKVEDVCHRICDGRVDGYPVFTECDRYQKDTGPTSHSWRPW